MEALKKKERKKKKGKNMIYNIYNILKKEDLK